MLHCITLAEIDPYSSLGDFVVVGLWLGVLAVLAAVNVAAVRSKRQAYVEESKNG